MRHSTPMSFTVTLQQIGNFNWLARTHRNKQFNTLYAVFAEFMISRFEHINASLNTLSYFMTCLESFYVAVKPYPSSCKENDYIDKHIIILYIHIHVNVVTVLYKGSETHLRLTVLIFIPLSYQRLWPIPISVPYVVWNLCKTDSLQKCKIVM